LQKKGLLLRLTQREGRGKGLQQWDEEQKRREFFSTAEKRAAMLLDGEEENLPHRWGPKKNVKLSEGTRDA